MATKTKVKDIDPNTASKRNGCKEKGSDDFYKSNISSETQLKYEELLRDIEKTRAERLLQMFIAQTMEPPTEGEESQIEKDFNEENEAREAARQIKRTLKRESNGV